MPEYKGVTRRRLLIATGGMATVSAAGCLGDDDDDGDGDSDDGDSDADGDDGSEPEPTEADKAQAAWQRIVDNAGPDAGDIREEAHVEIEEAVMDSAIMLNFLHDVAERMWWDHVEVPKVGALGGSHQQHHNTTLEGQSELNLINSTHNYIDPVESDDSASSIVITQLYERLVEYPNGVAELENQLLDEFEVSDDGLTYTFHLKEEVQFHDDREMTASDFKYAFRRVAEAPTSARVNFAISAADGIGIVHETDDDGNVVPDSLAIEVVDDYTFEMEIQNPNPEVMDIISYTAFSVYPEGIVGDIEGYDGEVEIDEFRQGMAVGTGPFQFDTFTLGEEFRATRFDDYHRETADVEAIHFEIVEEAEAQYTYAMEQNADIFGIPTQYYDPEAVEEGEEDDRGRISGTYGPHENGETSNYLSIPQMVTRYFGFNARFVPKPVRQAFAYVLDQQELVDDVFAGRGVSAYTFTPASIWPGGPDAYNDFIERYPYSRDETDLESARSVLEDAGYTEDDPFELTCTTYQSPTYQEAAGLLRDKLAGNGVEVELEETEFATLQERGYDGDLEMYSLGWSWSYPSLSYGHFGFEPKNTDTSGMPDENNGYYLDWQEELEVEE